MTELLAVLVGLIVLGAVAGLAGALYKTPPEIRPLFGRSNQETTGRFDPPPAPPLPKTPEEFMAYAAEHGAELFAAAREREAARRAVACIACGEPTAILCDACGRRVCVAHVEDHACVS